jgi:hypothetical protein
MSKRTPKPPAARRPHVIHPDAVYTLASLRQLHVTASLIRSERRAGRFRLARRGGRYYVLGRWILEWLESGEVPFPVQ